MSISTPKNKTKQYFIHSFFIVIQIKGNITDDNGRKVNDQKKKLEYSTIKGTKFIKKSLLKQRNTLTCVFVE